MQFNIFCDESCHLEHDRQRVMVLGAVACPTEKAREIAVRIREIKEANGVSPRMELKWGSVSPAKFGLYRDIIDYFFDDDDLAFRAVVADKAKLDHDSFGQRHDDWYFKTYFTLLSKMLCEFSEFWRTFSLNSVTPKSRSVRSPAPRPGGLSGGVSDTSARASRSGRRVRAGGRGSLRPDPHHAAPAPTPPAVCWW